MTKNLFFKTVFASLFCLVAIALSACSPVGLDSSESAIRSGLTVQRVPLPVELNYPSKGECLYQEDVSVIEGPQANSTMKINFRPVKDKIYVLVDNGGKTSGYLIGASGKLYDFNAEALGSGEKYNPETKGRISQEGISRMMNSANPLHHANPHSINDFEINFPEYLADRRTPGEIGAYVRSEDGQVWGNYKYAGISEYRGATVAVFDLVRNLSDGWVVGYTLVDTRTALPVHLAFRSGTSMKLDQISCK